MDGLVSQLPELIFDFGEMSLSIKNSYLKENGASDANSRDALGTLRGLCLRIAFIHGRELSLGVPSSKPLGIVLVWPPQKCRTGCTSNGRARDHSIPHLLDGSRATEQTEYGGCVLLDPACAPCFTNSAFTVFSLSSLCADSASESERIPITMSVARTKCGVLFR